MSQGRKPKLSPEKAMEKMGPNPSPQMVTRVLNQMSVKGRRKLRRLLKQRQTLSRTVDAARFREAGAVSQDHRHRLAMSGSDRYSLFDISWGYPLGASTHLWILVYKDVENVFFLDIRKWKVQLTGTATPDPATWKEATTTITWRPTRKGIRVKLDHDLLRYLMETLRRITDVIS